MHSGQLSNLEGAAIEAGFEADDFENRVVNHGAFGRYSLEVDAVWDRRFSDEVVVEIDGDVVVEESLVGREAEGVCAVKVNEFGFYLVEYVVSNACAVVCAAEYAESWVSKATEVDYFESRGE